LCEQPDRASAPLAGSASQDKGTGARLKLPQKPGLGIEMNMEFLRANVLDGFGGT